MAAISYLEQEGKNKLITDLTPLITPVGETPAVFQSLKFFQPGSFNQLELVSGNVPAIIVSIGNSGLVRYSDSGDMYNRTFIVSLIIEVVNEYTDILYYCDLLLDALLGKYYEMSWESGAQQINPEMNYAYRNLVVTMPGEQAI